MVFRGAAMKFWLPCFLLVLVFLMSAKCKKKEDVHAIEAYPENFPEECVEYFERWGSYIKKVEASGRLDDEALTLLKHHRKMVFKHLSEKRKGFHETLEKKKQYCEGNERGSMFAAIDNMDALTQEELEEELDLEFSRQVNKRFNRKP